MYMMMHTMKSSGSYNFDEMYEMYPYELEIFHAMCIKDIKDRVNAKQSG